MESNVDLRTKLDALRLSAQIFEALGSPRALTCALLLKYGEHKQLAELAIRPRDYTDAKSFFIDYQCTKLLSKSLELDTGIDTERVALLGVLAAEVKCKETNSRLRDSTGLTPGVSHILHVAAGKIAHVLGEVPDLSKLDLAFGPGSTYGVRRMTSVFHKAARPFECTFALSERLPELFSELPGLLGMYGPPDGGDGDTIAVDVQLVEGNELTFVPKNAKTARPIAIEATLNGMLQKGIGSHIRNRLKRFGIDLNNQFQNQALAASAYESGLCTIDLKAASDTISYALVLDLLPIEWFTLLDSCRSPNFAWEGRWFPYQKFSSMGNAYTFELESLIFWALTSAVCEVNSIPASTGVNLSVYGDDIIAPKEAFEPLRAVLEWCGFTINLEKSFHEGNFFESCGHDYFMGRFVRPVFFSRRLQEHIFDSNKALNDIWRIQNTLLSLDKEGTLQVRKNLERVRHWALDYVPHSLRRWGPSRIGLHSRLSIPSGDGWIYCAERHAKRFCVQRGGYACSAWGFQPKSTKIPADAAPRAVMAYAIYSPVAASDWDVVDYRSGWNDLPWEDSPSFLGENVSLRERGRCVLRKLDIPFWVHVDADC